jgi:phosphoglycolate phosphatase
MPYPTGLPRAVAFDLDGTLIDSRADIAAACNHTLAWAGRKPLPVETISGFVGDGARSLLAQAFGIPTTAPELEALFGEWQRYYLAHPVVHTRLMPGAERALASFAERAIPLALITNKARSVASAILDALDLARCFRAVYGGGDGPLKPSPAPVFRVAEQLGLNPQDLWLVGDGVQDIAAARAAGACAIAVVGGFHDAARLRAAEPDAVFRDLDELVDTIQAYR